jgi:hypothetical protein
MKKVLLAVAVLTMAAWAGAAAAKPPTQDMKIWAAINAPGGTDSNVGPNGEIPGVVAVPFEVVKAVAERNGQGSALPAVPPANYSVTAFADVRGTSRLFAVGDYGCASVRGNWHWGLYPYRVTLVSVPYWCGYAGQSITFLTNSQETSSQYLCGNENNGWYESGGGPGAFWRQTHAWANWRCPAYVGFSVHHWLEINVNANGNASYGANG